MRKSNPWKWWYSEATHGIVGSKREAQYRLAQAMGRRSLKGMLTAKGAENETYYYASKRERDADDTGAYAPAIYPVSKRNPRRRNKMRIKVRHRSRNRRVMKRNLPLKKKYGGKYFTVKAFARKYAKKFGGKAKARKQWSKLREAKHGSTKLKTQRNKRRRKARKSRLNFRSRSGR